MNTLTESLAINGGAPLAAQLHPGPWPPLSSGVEAKLLEIYRARKWSFGGPHETAFCEAFAAHHDAKHAIFMANGTVTLQCALQAVGVGPGDEVVVPALTWPATAMAALYIGAVPVFVDVEASTLCMSVEKMEQAITSRTRAIMPVHLYAGMADMEAIMAIAQKHGIPVIEDCAHMHGGRWNGRGIGSLGSIGSFSFQETKTMASGEGGICITNDDELAESLYRLKHIGYGPATKQGKAATGPREGLLCHNFRGTEFQAAILQDQLQALPALLARYTRGMGILRDRLETVPEIAVQEPGRLADLQGVYALGFTFQGELRAKGGARVREALVAEGLPVCASYGPVYRHVLWNAPAEWYRVAGDGCPVAEDAATNLVVLPHQSLGHDDELMHLSAEVLLKVARNSALL